MRLTRITKIRHRIFRDFGWPSDLHLFAQFNVIYGWNGCGKTTLSSLLSLVEKKVALTEGEAELEFDASTKVAGSAFASAPLPQVRVFNRDFINATLQFVGGIAPIYFLGEDSVEKQTQVEKLTNQLTSAEAEVDGATSAKRNAETRLDDFCVAQAKVIKELLTTGNSTAYNNYDKRKFKQAAQALTVQTAGAAILSDNQKAPLRHQKDAQPKPTIEKVIAPSLDLGALTQKVNALVARSVVAQTLDELTSNKDLAAWVQHGLMLHSGEHASDICRFCRQPLQAARRSALEAHFNDAFAAFQQELTTLLSNLRTATQRLHSLRLPEGSRFYEALVPEVVTATASVSAGLAADEAVIHALVAHVEAKRDNPFSPAAEASVSAEPPSTLGAAVTALNALVDQHNRMSEDFKRSVDDACQKLEASYVAEVHAEYLQRVKAVKIAETALEAVNGKPAGIKAQIHALESEILEHQRPADELTKELREYLGRDELHFEVKGTGYALTRGGQPVSHLSEGERTAIAFLYFLKSLQDKTFNMANGIVVIDDPVSSLDANALFSAFGYMKERTTQCGQLLILTHSLPFFRLVKNWFHHLPGQRKRNVEDRPARFFLLRSRPDSNGSRTVQLGPLDRLLEEYESEYQYLFKRVYDEAHRVDVDSLEHHYGLPNVARRLVEAFLAFRFPDLGGDDLFHRFERVKFDNAKKTRILRLLNTYSHAVAISDPEHDLSLLAETQPVLLDVLDMMKAVDKEHYEGLERLVAPAGGSS